MARLLGELWRDENALVSVEHALLLAVVALGAIFAWQALGRHELREVRRVNRVLRATTRAR